MKLMVVDDNQEFASTISEIVESFGYKTQQIYSPNAAIDYFFRHNDNILGIFLDIEFSNSNEINGIDLLEKFRRSNPTIPVVMITGKGTIDSAVKATKLGAANFIEKSLVSKDKIKWLLDTILPYSFKNDVGLFLKENEIIGRSKQIMEVGDAIIRYGRTDLNVLINGPTGTGKKLVAKALHNASRRSKQPFVTVDIPNIASEIFQSELFGHIKGAFTGANETKKGLFHEANNGTLFLDEIGELNINLQSNLLIPIEEKLIRKVGATQKEEINIRFISATDRNLIDLMSQNKFREQLYHRLRECEIELPPLDDRKEDIPDIVAYYLRKHNEELNDNKVFLPDAIDYLIERKWPGNVRELVSLIKLVCQTTLKDEINAGDIKKNLKDDTVSINIPQPEHIEGDLKNAAEVAKKLKIIEVLQDLNGNISKAAVVLGVSRETLHNNIKKFQINVDEYRVKKTTK
jgi:two-component system nitrogen regulation response regulator NtrX